MVGSFDNNSPNLANPRGSPLHSVSNIKIDLQQPSDTINGGERLSGIKHPRVQQKPRTTDEHTCRKYLSNAYVSKLDNKLLEGVGVPETQKLKHVVSWAELFLNKSSVRDGMQESSQSAGDIMQGSSKSVHILDQDTEKEIIQTSEDLQLLQANVFTGSIPFVPFENSSEHAARWSPPTSLISNILSSTSKSLCLTQITKHEREEKDIVVSTNISGECEADDHMHHSTRNVSFQKSQIACQANDSCTTAIGLNESENYFWAPLNDSSDEELPDVKAMNTSSPYTKEHKGSLDSSSFFQPENMKCFSLSELGGRLPSVRKTDSCEKWNPGTENILEIKEHKCKDFIWTVKPDRSSGTNNTAESTTEQTTNRDISLDPVTEVRKDASRDRLLDAEPLKEDDEPKKERNEPKSEHMLGRGKIFEEWKCAEEEQVDGVSNGANCDADQRGIELKSMMKEPTVQTSSFCNNSLLKPSENSTFKVSPDCFNLSYKSTNLCINCNSILVDMLPQFDDDSIPHKSDIVQRYVQEDVSENISDDVIKLIMGPKSISEEFLVPKVNVDDHKKLLWNDKFMSFSNHDNSVLAKYYFYLNCLSETKRLQREDKKHLFSCKVFRGFSEDVKFSSCCHCKSSNSYESEDTENMNKDFEASEVSCHNDERTEATKQQGSHPEEQESKPLFTNSCPNPSTDLELTNKRQSRNSHTSKEKKVSETRRIGTDVARRHWEKASIAWSSYAHGELKPRSRCFQRPASANETKGKNYKAWNLPSSGCVPFKQPKANSTSDVTVSNKNQEKTSNYQEKRSFLKTTNAWKEIQLTDCRCLNDDWLANLGNRHPQHFTLDHCHDETQRITDVGLKQFFQHCKSSLKELNIKSCSGPGLRGDTVLLHASAFCNHLTTVDVSWTGATDSGLIALIKASLRLKCLSANGCQITDDAVATLVEKHGKSLEKLEIFGCHAVTAKCLRSVAVKCSNLKVLNIGRVHKVTEDCLAKVVNSMRKLTSLNVTGLNMVRDCVVHLIVKKCPDLECLVLNSCSQVTDISLMEISTYLPTIRYLDVSSCKEVTDVGIQALVGSCSKLVYLDLSLTTTSRRGVCLLASFCFRTLECVKLSFCKYITLDAILKLCKNCKRLKILHLYGCRFMPDLKSIKKINKTVEVFHDFSVPAAKLSSE
ncbi:uncharacterized protein LOC128347663 isoform X2 [Hemicordylus capensis]|uniref:uncharacterized protein LOC128347663 isoform X2 n=1 Tax=Hemicordylus capensis TaxID=884348 RepID=UPI002303FF93|nr:uncharacterized protein LOC128347663 isoform X2 [Hemicordylus capensis]